MNLHAIRAIYLFEMARTWRTLMQSIASPVISTSLYFVVFGSAIGSRMVEIAGVASLVGFEEALFGEAIIGSVPACSRMAFSVFRWSSVAVN